MSKILLIEDDVTLCNKVKNYLEKYRHEVVCVKDFNNIEKEFEQAKGELVILDINLPYCDGFYLCRVFRQKSNVPIIFTSARSGDMEQIMGIELGADDYITKPFNLELLHAKIKGCIRRCYGEYMDKDFTKINGLEILEQSFKLKYMDKDVELTKNEMKLMKKLMENVDKITTREELLEAIWDETTFVEDNSLTVNITRIKAKLTDIGAIDIIKTKRGVGYILESQALV